MISPKLLGAYRSIHHYIGLFFAPIILFFSITGGLQMFSLHETTRGSSYTPPQLLVHLGQLHKKGTLYLPPRRAAPPAPTKAAGAAADPGRSDRSRSPSPEPASPQPHPLPFKIFAAATAVALVVSTVTGVLMAWRYNRRKWVVLATLAAGTLVPLILLAVAGPSNP